MPSAPTPACSPSTISVPAQGRQGEDTVLYRVSVVDVEMQEDGGIYRTVILVLERHHITLLFLFVISGGGRLFAVVVALLVQQVLFEMRQVDHVVIVLVIFFHLHGRRAHCGEVEVLISVSG
jgi:hypothetical protein